MFPKEFGANTGVTVMSKYLIQLKNVFSAAKTQNQLPQVFCKRRPPTASAGDFLWILRKLLRPPILKKICELLLLKIRASVTNLTKGGNSWILLYFYFKASSILNFAMTECFLFSQTYFYHKKVHITWDAVISSSLR